MTFGLFNHIKERKRDGVQRGAELGDEISLQLLLWSLECYLLLRHPEKGLLWAHEFLTHVP